MKQAPRDFYKQAIEIMASDQNWKRLCIIIAQNSPKVLCTAFEEIQPSMRTRVREEFNSNGFIAAIKLYRNDTGMGLKESKEWVEIACEDLREAV